MTRRKPVVLEALRLPELLRMICGHAGMPLPPESDAAEWFVIRTGAEPPEFFALLLEEALVEDEAEVVVQTGPGPPDLAHVGPSHIAVLPGFGSACPASAELLQAVAPPGQVLLFAAERWSHAGELLGTTWAALPGREPAPEGVFRAAVFRDDLPTDR